MGNNNGNQENQEQNNGRDELLVENEQNNNEPIIDPTALKNIIAVRNPFMIKKTSLSLEKDSVDENKLYIKFIYSSLVDFNCYINFNVSRNTSKSLASKKDENYNLSYKPSDNFVQKSIEIKNVPKGDNLEFFEEKAVIDLNYLKTNKSKNNDKIYDVCIELVPVDDDDDSKDKNEIVFVTLCNLEQDELKIELQKLKTYGIWIDVYDIYNSSLENGECVICCADMRSCIFLPCRHACTCKACAHHLKMRNSACPICKKKIKDLLFLKVNEKENKNGNAEKLMVENNNNLISNFTEENEEQIKIKDEEEIKIKNED